MGLTLTTGSVNIAIQPFDVPGEKAADERRDNPHDETTPLSEELMMVIAALHDLAAVQASDAQVIDLLVRTVDKLVTASATLHDSLAQLLAWADAPDSERRALREQAHQLEHHADDLQQNAKQLRDRAESLTTRAYELMGESERLVASQSRSAVDGVAQEQLRPRLADGQEL